MKKYNFSDQLAMLVLILICGTAWATTLTHTVEESGGDFGNFSAAVAHLEATHTNLVAADVNAVIISVGNWTNPVNEDISIGTTLVTDSTHTLIIIASDLARHNGKAAAVSGRLNYRNNGGTLYVHSSYTTVSGLEFYGKNCGDDVGSVVNVAYEWPYPHYLFMDSLLVHDFSGRCSGINFNAGYSDSVLSNSIVYNGAADYQRGIFGYNSTEGQVYNNTVYNVGNATGQGSYGYGIAAFAYMKNNIAVGNGGASPYDFVSYTGSSALNYNISSDTSAAGTNSLTGKTAANLFVSVTPGAEDLHLKSSAAARDVGTDLSGVFTTDIDLEVRPSGSVWDIGADEQGSLATVVRSYIGRNSVWNRTIFE